MKSPNIRYLIGVDHLRAFAALLIVYYHGLHLLGYSVRASQEPANAIWLKTWNPFSALVIEGHTAVSLFMVLSGFIFSFGAGTHEIRYWPFIKNRLLRIYPLFIVIIVVGIAAYPEKYSFLSLVQTIFQQSGLKGALGLEPFSSMFWAVSIEFQFYLLFPFLHRFLNTYGIRWAGSLILLSILLRALACNGDAHARDISYWQILGRIDQFMIGMLAAQYFSKVTALFKTKGLITILSGIIVSSALVIFNQLGGWPQISWWKILWPTVEGTCWAMFLLCYVPLAQSATPGYLSKAFAYIGTLSYSIYLLHFSFLTFVPRWISFRFDIEPNLQSQLFTTCFVLPPLLALSALTYYVIEHPFLSLRVNYLNKNPK